MDNQGKKCYLADMATHAIFMKEMEDKTDTFTEIGRDYEGETFLGPHALALTEDANKLYFTDSGPWGETSIENPRGSVFVADIELGIVRPLALNCLAFPTGLVLANKEKVL